MSFQVLTVDLRGSFQPCPIRQTLVKQKKSSIAQTTKLPSIFLGVALWYLILKGILCPWRKTLQESSSYYYSHTFTCSEKRVPVFSLLENL